MPLDHELTDEALALGLQRGETDDLILLIERHYDGLVGYLYQLNGGGPDVDPPLELMLSMPVPLRLLLLARLTLDLTRSVLLTLVHSELSLWPLVATQPDPRRAVPVVVVVTVLLPAILGFDPSGNWRDAFNPLRPGLFFYYTDTLKPQPEDVALVADNASIKLISIEATILTGLAQLAVVWLVIWHWLRRQMG